MPQENTDVAAHAQAAAGLEQRVRQHLEQLLAQDPRLVTVHAIAGEVRPRIRPAGFAGLARIICGQQLSVASADAIWGRLVQSGATGSPAAFLALDADRARAAGLSRGKLQAIDAVARALLEGELDLSATAALPADEAIATLTRHRGVGPWTAEIYLMFCAAHPDIFPAGDLALRRAVGEAFELPADPAAKALAGMAHAWAPWRSTAALLFWRFYAARRHRNALPV